MQLRIQIVGNRMEVEALQLKMRQRLGQPNRFGSIGFVDAELRRAPRHNQRRFGERSAQVYAQQHRGHLAETTGDQRDAAQLMHALRMDQHNAKLQRLRDFVILFAGSPENNRLVCGYLADFADFSDRRRFKAIDDRRQTFQIFPGRIRLHRVKQPAPFRQAVRACLRPTAQFPLIVQKGADRLGPLLLQALHPSDDVSFRFRYHSIHRFLRTFLPQFLHEQQEKQFHLAALRQKP